MTIPHCSEDIQLSAVWPRFYSDLSSTTHCAPAISNWATTDSLLCLLLWHVHPSASALPPSPGSVSPYPSSKDQLTSLWRLSLSKQAVICFLFQFNYDMVLIYLPRCLPLQTERKSRIMLSTLDCSSHPLAWCLTCRSCSNELLLNFGHPPALEIKAFCSPVRIPNSAESIFLAGNWRC